MPTDAKTMTRSPQHDHSGRQVFEILAREHADMLVTYLRALVRSADAVDDLFQETMLIAWRRLGDYEADRPFGPWLRGIAARLVLKHRERRARDVVACDSELLAAIEGRFAALSRFPPDFRESVEALLECVRGLPERLRDAVKLAYEGGLFLRDVADELGVSEEAVKKRVQRGRQLLAECLRSAGVLS